MYLSVNKSSFLTLADSAASENQCFIVQKNSGEAQGVKLENVGANGDEAEDEYVSEWVTEGT